MLWNVACVDGMRLYLWTATSNGHIVRPPDNTLVWRTTVKWYWLRNPEELGENPCLSATLSTTNSTWTDQGANPVLRSERLATNHLSHGTANYEMLQRTSNLDELFGTMHMIMFVGRLIFKMAKSIFKPFYRLGWGIISRESQSKRV